MEMFCPNCGEALSSSGAKCTKCSWQFDESKKEWCFAWRTNYRGPYTAEQMRNYIANRTIKPETLVFVENSTCASNADKSVLQAEFEKAPKASANLMESWALALMSLPAFVSILIIRWFSTGEFWWHIICAVLYIALGALCLIKDKQEVEGHEVKFFKPWMYAGIVLAPLYLLPRVRVTSKRYMYCLLWLIFVGLYFF